MMASFRKVLAAYGLGDSTISSFTIPVAGTLAIESVAIAVERERPAVA
jgi:hypothetical protein